MSCIAFSYSLATFSYSLFTTLSVPAKVVGLICTFSPGNFNVPGSVFACIFGGGNGIAGSGNANRGVPVNNGVGGLCAMPACGVETTSGIAVVAGVGVTSGVNVGVVSPFIFLYAAGIPLYSPAAPPPINAPVKASFAMSLPSGTA